MSTTDFGLLKRWRDRGDSEAFQELVRRHAGMVFGTCRRILRSPEDAEEITQDCFVRLADDAPPPSRSLGGWLHALATSRSLDRIRGDHRRRAREVQYAAVESQPSDGTMAEVLERVDEALATIPERLREPIVAHYLEGLTHKEVGVRLGISRASATRRIQEGVERLRDALRGRGTTVSVAALAAALESQSATAAPATLTAALGKWALAQAAGTAVVGGGAFGGLGVVMTVLVSIAVVGSVLSIIFIAAPGALDRIQNRAAAIPTALPSDTTQPEADPVALDNDVSSLTAARVDPIDTPSQSEATAVPASLAAGARVTGVVLDLDGNPVPQAVVVGVSESDVLRSDDLSTGHDGAFAFENVAPTKRFRLYATFKQPPQCSPAVEVHDLLAGGAYEVELTLHAAQISGYVVDTRGASVADADVIAWTDSVPGQLVPKGTSDARGQFVVRGLFASTYQMKVRTASDQPYIGAAQVMVGSDEHASGVKLVHDPYSGGVIWGSVTDASGMPIDGAKVDAHNIREGASTHAYSDPSGQYVLTGLTAAEFRLQIAHRDYGHAARTHVATGSGPVDIVLEARGAVSGTVVNVETGQPIQQFEILEMTPVDDSPAPMYHQRWEPRFDEMGAFHLQGLNPGNATISVRADGMAPVEHRALVYPGDTTRDVVVKLESAQLITGTIVDDNANPIAGANVFAGPIPANHNGANFGDTEVLRSDALGRFRLTDAPKSTKLVTAYHHAYATGWSEVSGDGDNVTVILRNGGAIEGKVYLGGEPASGAVWISYEDWAPYFVERQETDNHGRFAFAHVTPGLATITASMDVDGDGAASRYKRIPVSAKDGQTSQVSVVLEPGTAGISGRITENGIAVEALVITAKRESPDGSAEYFTAVTDYEGRYAIESMLPGNWAVEVLADSTGARSVAASTDVVLEPGAVTIRDFTL